MELALEFYSEFKSLVKGKISEISNLSEAADFRFSRVNVTNYWLGDDVFRTWNGHDFDDVVHVKEISENNAVPSFNDELSLDREYAVIVNDTDLAYGTIRRTLADINKFNLSDYKAFVPNTYKNVVAIMDKDSIPEVVSYLASEKIEFSKIREAVIAARKIDSENKKKAGIAPKKKSDAFEDRSVEIFGTDSDGNTFYRYSTLGEVKNDMSEYKIYASYKTAYGTLHRQFPLPVNTVSVTPATNVTVKTFEKYVEILGAEKVNEQEIIAKAFESTINESVSDENWEIHKRIIKSPIVNQTDVVSFPKFAELLEDDLVEIVNKVQMNRGLSRAIGEIRSGNKIISEKLGINGEEIGTSEDFALLSVIGYGATRIVYGDVGASHRHLAEYMNNQWKQMKEAI